MTRTRILPSLPCATVGALLLCGCGDDGVTSPTTGTETDPGTSSTTAIDPDTSATPTSTGDTGDIVTATSSSSSEPSGSGTDTSGDTGEPIDCLNTPDLCGAGTVCDPDSLACVADCSVDASLCGPGTVCSDGLCKPDCSGDVAACGAGTVCGPDLVCVIDCRTNLLDVCAGEALCDRTTGVCAQVPAFDCNAAPALCQGDQTCGDDGFCRAAALDSELAYDVQHYDLRLDLRTADQAFSAELAVSLRATVDDTVELALDVGAETLIDGEPWRPYDVLTVTDGADLPLEFVQDAAGALTVTLAQPLAAGDAAVLRITYAGDFNAIADEDDPLYYTGIMQRAGKSGDAYVQTFGWPVYTRRWLPSHDHPRDIATFSADVGIDNGFTVLANGVPVRSGAVDGLQRTAFVLQQPVPTYAMHVIASEFELVRLGVVDGVPVDAVVHAAETGYVAELWGVAVGALALFNDRLGAYPFARYAMISVPSAFGGMEHATIVSMADTKVVPGDPGTHRTAIHELSHHWFGDSAHQAEWPAFWLNESLATHLELEALRVLGGQSLYSERLGVLRNVMFNNPPNFDGDALHYEVAQQFPGEVNQASFVAPYAKGPWVWHMLRMTVGEDAFIAGLRDLYEAHSFAPYSSDTALAVLSDSTGVDLTQFFAEWVHTPGWPVVKATWAYDDLSGEVDLTVEQVQDPLKFGTYTLEGALALEFVFDDGDPMTPTCDLTAEFATGETLFMTSVACATAPTGFTLPSQADVLVELAP